MENKAASASRWVEQSKLLWSRLQTASVIEAAALAAAYKMCMDRRRCLQILVLALGMVLLLLVFFLMKRDAEWLDAFHEAAGDCLPKVKELFWGLKGRCIGYIAVFTLIIADFGWICCIIKNL